MNEVRHPVADAEIPIAPYFTAAEFDRMSECGAFGDMRVELVGGELQKMTPPNLGHGARSVEMSARLYAALANRPYIVAADLAVQIDELTIRIIDIAVVHADASPRGSIAADQVFLAAEISETTQSRDLGEKVRDYARAGIPHYWVVDGRASVIHVFGLPEGDEYRETRVVRFGEPLDVPGSGETIVLG